ncbi:hypothetical protein C0993_003734 [Termitomyces sp. T159_Od127]|nr:hypothetical protein C0993_003734 [Termitomyces sp. T159_Od127]
MPAMTYRTEPAVPADIITYRLDSKLVYVRPADDYEQALDYAQKEYPELAELERSRISFRINAKLNGQSQSVRISASAWSAAVSRLLRGEIIDVCIEPSIDANTVIATTTLPFTGTLDAFGKEQAFLVLSALKQPDRSGQDIHIPPGLRTYIPTPVNQPIVHFE